MQSITLTTIIIEDTRSSGFAGYFAEFPELMAQGDTQKELQDNLISSLTDHLSYKKGQVLFSAPSDQKVDTLNFVLA